MKTRMILAVLAAFLIFPSISVTAYAGGGDSSSGAEPPPEQQIIDITPRTEAPAPADSATDTSRPELPGETASSEEIQAQPAADGAQPFTPAGTGTVLDNATSEDGKEFFTITTASDNIFYLVIDRQRSGENVYFLNAVTEADLMALAEVSAPPATPEPVEPPTTTDPEPEPDPEPEKKGMGPLPLVLLILLVGGGAGWYFKIYRPKQQAGADAEDNFGEAEGDAYEPGDLYADDPGYGDWPEEEADPLDIIPEDDSQPWVDEDGGEDE